MWRVYGPHVPLALPSSLGSTQVQQGCREKSSLTLSLVPQQPPKGLSFMGATGKVVPYGWRGLSGDNVCKGRGGPWEAILYVLSQVSDRGRL